MGLQQQQRLRPDRIWLFGLMKSIPCSSLCWNSKFNSLIPINIENHWFFDQFDHFVPRIKQITSNRGPFLGHQNFGYDARLLKNSWFHRYCANFVSSQARILQRFACESWDFQGLQSFLYDWPDGERNCFLEEGLVNSRTLAIIHSWFLFRDEFDEKWRQIAPDSH